jgi:hypothetical protein
VTKKPAVGPSAPTAGKTYRIAFTGHQAHYAQGQRNH